MTEQGFSTDTEFSELLANRYRPELEDRAIDILERHPALATAEWWGPDHVGQPRSLDGRTTKGKA